MFIYLLNVLSVTNESVLLCDQFIDFFPANLELSLLSIEKSPFNLTYHYKKNILKTIFKKCSSLELILLLV